MSYCVPFCHFNKVPCKDDFVTKRTEVDLNFNLIKTEITQLGKTFFVKKKNLTAHRAWL